MVTTSSDESSIAPSVNQYGYTNLQNALSLEALEDFHQNAATMDADTLRQQLMYTTRVPARTITLADGSTRTQSGYTTETALCIAERYCREYMNAMETDGTTEFEAARLNEWMNVVEFIKGVTAQVLV
jgi:hypothetical protein